MNIEFLYCSLKPTKCLSNYVCSVNILSITHNLKWTWLLSIELERVCHGEMHVIERTWYMLLISAPGRFISRKMSTGRRKHLIETYDDLLIYIYAIIILQINEFVSKMSWILFPLNTPEINLHTLAAACHTCRPRCFSPGSSVRISDSLISILPSEIGYSTGGGGGVDGVPHFASRYPCGVWWRESTTCLL